MNTTEEYVLIVHTGNDLIIEESSVPSFDIHSYARQKQVAPGQIEVITKREFNDRLDRMLVEF